MLGGDEIGGGRLLVVASNQVDVLGGATAVLEAEVEREGALEDPASWGGHDQACEQAVEHDGLPQPHQGLAGGS